MWKKPHLHCWWVCKQVQPLWKVVWRFLKKLGIKRAYDPAKSNSQAFTPRKPKLKKTHVPKCSLQHYLQQLEHRSCLDVHQQMNGKRSCSTYIQWNTAAAAAKSLQSFLTLRPHRWQTTRLHHPWDSPGKNTGVGCYFLLQCMKVKSESEVAQPCLTASDPMDCRLPGSSIHGIFQARVLE